MDTKRQKPVVTKEAIAAGLRDLGIRRGDPLFVHSSLSAFGHVDGGAEAVCDGLIEAVGMEGTVAVPTFTWGKYHAKPIVTFDVRHDATENGAIPNALRLRPDAIRSDHVCHSVAAVGARAWDVMGDGVRPFAWGSSMYRLHELDFWYAFLGCGFNSCTALHTVEELMQAPYRRYRHFIGSQVIRADGSVLPSRAVEFLMERPFANDFGKMEAVYQEAGVLRVTHIGNARILLARTRDIIRIGVRLLREDIGYLLTEEARAYLTHPWQPPAPEDLSPEF